MNAHLGDLLTPLVDGQLDHASRERALVHVTHCAACQRAVVAERRLKARLGALGGPQLPSSFVDRLVGLPSVPARSVPPPVPAFGARWPAGPDPAAVIAALRAGMMRSVVPRQVPSDRAAPPAPVGLVAAAVGADLPARGGSARPRQATRRPDRVRQAVFGGVAIILAMCGGVALRSGAPAAGSQVASVPAPVSSPRVTPSRPSFVMAPASEPGMLSTVLVSYAR